MRCEINNQRSHHPPYVNASDGQESPARNASSDRKTLGCVLPTVIYHSLSSSSSPTSATRPTPLQAFLCTANLGFDTVGLAAAANHTT